MRDNQGIPVNKGIKQLDIVTPMIMFMQKGSKTSKINYIIDFFGAYAPWFYLD
jgi:hypothetical protein